MNSSLEELAVDTPETAQCHRLSGTNRCCKHTPARSRIEVHLEPPINAQGTNSLHTWGAATSDDSGPTATLFRKLTNSSSACDSTFTSIVLDFATTQTL